MAGTTKSLSFSEGVTVSAPSQTFLKASSIQTYADSAAYISAKGTAAEEGDFFGNTGTSYLNYYDGTRWSIVDTVLNNFSASTSPAATDDTNSGYSVGSHWYDTTADKGYFCIDASASAASWTDFEGTVNPTITTKTADYTVQSTDDTILVGTNAAATHLVMTLPAAATNIGKIFNFMKYDAGSSGIIIDGNGAETIDGSLTTGLYGQFDGVNIVCDGTGWHSIARNVQQICYLRDVKANNTNSGTFTGGSVQTRILNVLNEDGGITNDGASFCSLLNNQFVLYAGTYHISFTAQTYEVDAHRASIYDITNSAYAILGNSGFSNSSANTEDASMGSGTITITSNTTFELRHECATSSAGAEGFGKKTNFGESEVFAEVVIRKIK